MKNRFKPLRKDATTGDIYDRAMKLKTKEEAKDYLERLVELGMSHGQTREEALRIQKANLGYWAGYYDPRTAKRVFSLFEAAHPVFGTTYPGPEEAIKKGVELAKKSGARK